MSNKAISVYAEALKRNQEEGEQTRAMVAPKAAPKPARKLARKTARRRAKVHDRPPDPATQKSLDTSHERSRDRAPDRAINLPSREEIQEFSFRLRDAVNVKVQPRIPHPWQKELTDIARDLDVKKFELYRFIIGEFLGKVRRKKPA